MPRLVSVNIGQPQPISSKSGMTGIFKKPSAEPVTVTRDGLEGDAIIDRRHHGGVDQAVYVYFTDDYAHWSEALGKPVTAGTFGENLTIDGVEGRSVGAGDRFTIGEVTIEVTAHRTPCSTLAARMEDPTFLKAYHRAGRPGAYCRVLTPGQLQVGQDVVHQPFDGEPVTVAEMMALEGKRDIERDVLRRVLAAPVHHKMRDDFEQRLSRLF
ncbi:molybdenum cofactor biosysynthesis protein [Devosia pacifica]|uniref:Molybdenum cofactor biosysynthesis protein n=1 Tax=Devosia pacifica TaxID=1335967 RepID=A0A918S5R2_9HYPH|nr:MOSC domain-containing protein [Devosia pacifica]GHA25927.1 molybdenum cofactor biosysynthesis protein [Devosia pacifica]